MRVPMLDCLRVTLELQSYLDGMVDEVTARRIAAHLEDCRRCGLRADTYTAIKTALARREPTPPPELLRLRAFADALATDEDNASGEAG